jgi:small Trp-rich protein
MAKSISPTFPILGILGLILVAFKLADVGDVGGWSWWWVLAPFWGPFAATLLVFGFLGAVIGIKRGLDALDLWWQRRKEVKANG